MSLTLALNTALTSLNVNQRSLATLSQNIANANNKEYSRQIVNQEAVTLQGTGSGVRIRDIGRKVDSYLQGAALSQQSSYSRTEVVADYTERLQVLLGKPGSSNSIYSYATSFFNSLQSAAQTPENASLRVNAVNLANKVASEMGALADGIYDMQYSIDQDIKRSIDSVNTAAAEIYELNGTIAANKLLGRPTSDLEDRRDSQLNIISSMVDVQTYTSSTGVLNVFTASGGTLVDENLYQMAFNPASSADFYANNNPSNPIQIYRVNQDGSRGNSVTTVVSGGRGNEVVSSINGGKIKGLLDLRSGQLPDVLAKLDTLAAGMRDEMNAVHNSGTAYPGANSYTGTRPVTADSLSQWSGQMRLAVLNSSGEPVDANYTDEAGGLRPLLIDFDTLNTGQGTGNASLQGIINEINSYYGVPQNKVELGDLNDIRLVLNNDKIPGLPQQLDFDFQLDNISGSKADFFVSGVQVLNDQNVDITNLTQDVPKVALSSTNTYTTTQGSNDVVVQTAIPHGYKPGDKIYLAAPPSDVDGITRGSLGGYFTITNVTANSFTITAQQAAVNGGTTDQPGLESRAVYATSETGTSERTTANGTIINNLAGQSNSSFYTVKANVAVKNADGTVSTSTVTYRIDSLGNNVRNYRYAGQAATDDGLVVQPNTVKPAMRAIMVDANGNELQVINGSYVNTEKGYLKLVATDPNNVVAIDSLNSAEQGQPNGQPAVAATNRSFSHYFELNNLFVNNLADGAVKDSVVGSANNMAVSKALLKNTGLLSVGKLVQSAAPLDPSQPPRYTYERAVGDNSILDQLAKFSTTTIAFGAAGDLGATNQTITAYAGEMLSTVSTKATANQSDMENASLLLEGFTSRSDAVRGVNLDEELANTIIYQNAYSASARIITVANEFFDELMGILK